MHAKTAAYTTESQQVFNKVFTNQIKKFRDTPNTIFENLEYVNESESYLKFIDSKYYDMVIQENSVYTKMQIIQSFLLEEYSAVYYEVKKQLELQENGISFGQHYLLENTLEVFPGLVKTEFNQALFEESIMLSSDTERFQELTESFGIRGAAYTGGAAAGTMALGGTPLLAAGIGIATSLALELFMPTRWSLSIDKKILGFVTFLTRSLLGTGSMISNLTDSFQASQKGIESYDNIDMNKDLIHIFERIGQRHTFNSGNGAESLKVIMSKCIDANKELFDKDNFFSGQIQNGNIYRNVLNSMLINNGNRTTSNSLKYDKLLRFRKCIASSLSDVYKFTMITNLKDVRNYQGILKATSQGFNVHPEQLLSFVDVQNEHAKEIKENLLDLIRLRMIINEMIQTFKQGNFDVDREAGAFLEQKFKMVDKEISDYLGAHKLGAPVFDKKEFGGIPPKSPSPFNNKYRPIIGNSSGLPNSNPGNEQEVREPREVESSNEVAPGTNLNRLNF